MNENCIAIDLKLTGEKIKTLREKAGMKVKDLQNVFGFTAPQAIYKWQQGTTLPTIDNLVILSSVLDVKIEDILVIRSKD